MIKDPDPKKKQDEPEQTPAENDSTYVEPETIDSHEPEELDSDDQKV